MGQGDAVRRVLIESPFAGDVKRNLKYLRACLRDSLLRGEAPFASHAIYTQPGVLDDDKPDDRSLGMKAGWAWMKVADAVAVYRDLGVTPGMEKGMETAREILQLPIENRWLGVDWETQPMYKTRWE
jgi:hypothetical protein